MVSSSIFEDEANPWGIEQAYLSAKRAYEFLGAGENIILDLRHGLHSPSARDIERYLDFFDYIFKRGDIKPVSQLYYDYSFSKWLGLSGEKTDPLNFPVKRNKDLLAGKDGRDITDVSSWRNKVNEIRKNIRWGLGEEPPSVAPGNQPDYMRELVTRPRIRENINSVPVGFGNLYYPKLPANSGNEKQLPVIIFIHEYSYTTGYGRRFQSLLDGFLNEGFAVYAMDQIGFGTRIEEGRLFYQRFPHWSKMGRMVADVGWSIDELSDFDFLDTGKIYVAGYSLGGTVALYSAALDDRITGVVSVGGFTPMRSDTAGKTATGIYKYSHLHGLIPRLGFFTGEEQRIPYDFNEILACIAPRPVLLIAPKWDQYSDVNDIEECAGEVSDVYKLYKNKDYPELFIPEDYNRFSPEMEKYVIGWLRKQ